MSPLLLALAPLAHADPISLPKPEPYGLLQVWITAYDMDQDPQADPAGYGDPEDDPGFKIRRARLGFEGSNDQLRYGLIVGTSAPYDAVLAQGSSVTGGDIRIVDAYAGYAPMKDLWIQAGVQHVPVSRDNIASSGDQTFQEEAVSTIWMTPGRDAGLVADADFGVARVRLGAFNGNGSLISDDNNGKLVAARAELKLGDKASAYRTFGRVDHFVFGYGLDAFYNGDVATSTLNAGTDLMLRVSGLAFQAEARWASIKPTSTTVADPDVLDATTRLGWLAQVGWSAGAFEPALRVSSYDDDMGSSDNGDVMDAQLGLTWHALDDHVRVGGGYIHRMELGGSSLPDDTARLWMQMKL